MNRYYLLCIVFLSIVNSSCTTALDAEIYNNSNERITIIPGVKYSSDKFNIVETKQLGHTQGLSTVDFVVKRGLSIIHYKHPLSIDTRRFVSRKNGTDIITYIFENDNKIYICDPKSGFANEKTNAQPEGFPIIPSFFE